MEMASLLTHCVLPVLSLIFLQCDAQPGYTVDAILGQQVEIPCGVKVNGQTTRLVWKFGQNRRELAFSFDGSVSCDIAEKDCTLKPDGSLVLRNVEETDSGYYYCEINGENYYSEHLLVVHPEAPPVAFEICPNSEDVFVYQTGPEEMVLAYTNPVCRNIDVVGSVTCDPPSGVRIGTNFSEIACRCTHSGNLVDTCKIPLPDVPPSFENCPGSDSVSVRATEQSSLMWLAYTNPVCQNSKGLIGSVTCDPRSGTETNDKKIKCRCSYSGRTVDTCEIQIPDTCITNDVVCSLVTPLGIVCGILVGIVIGVIIIVVWRYFAKYRSEHSKDKENGTVKKDPTASFGSSCQVQNEDIRLSESGQPLVCSSELENDAVDCPDGDMQIENVSPQSFTEMKQIFITGEPPKFRILPSMNKPSNGIEIRCRFCRNLDMDLHENDVDTVPGIQHDVEIWGLSVDVAKLLTLPVHITCGKCGESCCTLEIFGDKWMEQERKALLKEEDL